MATTRVPDGCGLTLTTDARFEDDEGQDTYIVLAECACNHWEQEYSAPIVDLETEGRRLWLTGHLVPMQEENDGEDA